MAPIVANGLVSGQVLPGTIYNVLRQNGCLQHFQIDLFEISTEMPRFSNLPKKNVRLSVIVILSLKMRPWKTTASLQENNSKLNKCLQKLEDKIYASDPPPLVSFFLSFFLKFD